MTGSRSQQANYMTDSNRLFSEYGHETKKAIDASNPRKWDRKRVVCF